MAVARGATRQWCRDKRRNVLYAPVFQMLFATSSNSEGELDIFSDSEEGSHWRLLLYNMSSSCREVLWETSGTELVENIFRSVPASLHPASFDVRFVTVGDTHDKLGLFSDRAFLVFKARLEHVLAPLGLGRTTASRHHLTNIVAGCGLPGTVGEAVRWAVERDPTVADVSAPSQVGNDAILMLMPSIHPLLYMASFREGNAHIAVGSEVATPASEGGGGREPEPLQSLEQERRIAIENLKKRVGHVVSFTLPTCSNPAGSPATADNRPWHVLLIQKPYVEKEEVSEENLDPGPLAPQPVGAELHIMQDAGEVLYLQQRLCDERSFDTVYDDMMHEDGELFAQFCPLEGIAFDDIDRFLSFASTWEQTPEVFTGEPLCKGSCSSYVFPKVVYRTPTGSAVKDTPIASAHVVVVESSPRTTEDWSAAATAFQFISQNLIGCPDGSYTLPLGLSPVTPPAHNEVCSWCQRRRDKLLRCGGCRVDMYCCKKHQMSDWKNGHRDVCGLWRKAREEYEQHVVPHLQEQRDKLPSTAVASTAVTLLKFLVSCAPQLRRKVNPIVHVVGVEAEVGTFLGEFAPRVVAARCGGSTTPLEWSWKQLRFVVCSDTFPEEEQNAVYAITNDGNVVRTPPTTTLGDVWHTHSSELAAEAAVLLRFCCTKYHIFIHDTMGSTRSLSSAIDADDRGPSAVVHFGKLMGSGMTYFSGAAEVLADWFIGLVPVLCTEATFINAHASAQAIFARVKGSSSMSKDRKTAVMRYHKDVNALIRLNTMAIGLYAVDPHTSSAVEGPLPARETALLRHPNLYQFIIPSLGDE